MLRGCPLTHLEGPTTPAGDNDAPMPAPDISARLRALEDPKLARSVPETYTEVVASSPDALGTARRVVTDVARRTETGVELVNVESMRWGTARGDRVTEITARCVVVSEFFEFALLARFVERQNGEIAYVTAGRTDEQRFRQRTLADDLDFSDVWSQTRTPALYEDALTRLERSFEASSA